MGFGYAKDDIDSALAKTNGSIDEALKILKDNKSNSQEGEIINWSQKKKDHYHKAIMNPFDTAEEFDPFSEENIQA